MRANNVLITVIASAASAAVAGTAAWFTAKAKYEKFYRELAEFEIGTEIAQFKADFRKNEAIRQVAPKIEVMEFTAEEVAETAELLKEDMPEEVVQALGAYQGGMVVNSRIDYTKPDKIKVDLEAEAPRPPVMTVVPEGEPHSYVITQEMYLTNESGFEQVNVTYYEGDDVLADERDEPSETAKKLLGENMRKFGDKSGDPNIVYVRVPAFEMEFEVIRDHSSYSSVVAGIATPEG